LGGKKEDAKGVTNKILIAYSHEELFEDQKKKGEKKKRIKKQHKGERHENGGKRGISNQSYRGREGGNQGRIPFTGGQEKKGKLNRAGTEKKTG